MEAHCRHLVNQTVSVFQKEKAKQREKLKITCKFNQFKTILVTLILLFLLSLNINYRESHMSEKYLSNSPD